jgi:hypothetical protein
MVFARVLKGNPFEDWFGILCLFLPKSVNRGKFIKFTKYNNKNLVHNLASLKAILKYFVKYKFIDEKSKKLLIKVLKRVILMIKLSFHLERQIIMNKYDSLCCLEESQRDKYQLYPDGRIVNVKLEDDYFFPLTEPEKPIINHISYRDMIDIGINYFTNNYFNSLYGLNYVPIPTEGDAKFFQSSYIEIFDLKNKLEKLIFNSFL